MKSLAKRVKGGIFSLRRSCRMLFELYNSAVWSIFYPFFKIYSRYNRKVPKRVCSVLHVSYMSHKPFMLSRLMRQEGLKSSYLALNGENRKWLHIGEKGYDYNIPGGFYYWALKPWIAVYHFWNIMRHHDVIHFHFASLLTLDGRELACLKKMGKVLVFHFRGCDLRRKSINERLYPDLNCCQECDYPKGKCDSSLQNRQLSLARKYGDIFLVTTPDLLEFMPEAEHMPFVAPYCVDIEGITPIPKNKDIFRVVTSSNHHGIDGTEYIRQAVKRLQEEGERLELIEVHKTPYKEALSIYKSADLFIGKLRMGCYNNTNIECMMMGIPNMSYIRERFLRSMPDCPIVITRPGDVYQRLKEYIENPQDLREIGLRGPEFVKKYHDSGKIVGHMVKKYNKALDKKNEDD